MLSGMLSWCRGRELLRTAALLALFCMLVATEDPLVSLAAGALDYGAWPGEMELAVYVSGIVEGVQYVLFVEELDASEGAAGHSLQLVSTVFSSPALAERRVHGGGFEVTVTARLQLHAKGVVGGRERIFDLHVFDKLDPFAAPNNHLVARNRDVHRSLPMTQARDLRRFDKVVIDWRARADLRDGNGSSREFGALAPEVVFSPYDNRVIPTPAAEPPAVPLAVVRDPGGAARPGAGRRSTDAAEDAVAEWMLWWLPVRRMASETRAASDAVLLYSPTHRSEHGKETFQLAFHVKAQTLPGCVLISLYARQNASHAAGGGGGGAGGKRLGRGERMMHVVRSGQGSTVDLQVRSDSLHPLFTLQCAACLMYYPAVCGLPCILRGSHTPQTLNLKPLICR